MDFTLSLFLDQEKIIENGDDDSNLSMAENSPWFSLLKGKILFFKMQFKNNIYIVHKSITKITFVHVIRISTCFILNAFVYFYRHKVLTHCSPSWKDILYSSPYVQVMRRLQNDIKSINCFFFKLPRVKHFKNKAWWPSIKKSENYLTDKSIVLHIITSYILSFPTTTHMIHNQMTRTYSADNYITETSGCAF